MSASVRSALSDCRLSRAQVIIGVALACASLATVSATLTDAGVTWDEPLYMKASRTYVSWFGLLKRGVLDGDVQGPFRDEAIVAGWMPHPTLELHPPLGKVLSGLSFATLRGIWGELASYRFSNAALFSLLVALVFWLVASAYDTTSGLFAALSLLLMPRMFFHAHLANIDTTVAITWFLAMYAFWRLESKPGWLPVVIMGLFFGLALATKMNAIVMPLVWGVWVLLFRRNWRSIFRLGVVSAIGAGVFVATWPWLYHDTANRLLYYVLMASRFKDRPQYYLGQTWPHVPWHYPFVITLAVVPLVITMMYLLGSLQVVRRRGCVRFGPGKASDETGWLLLLNALIPLLFAATGLQAAYSGERHFISTYPYLACLAGVGFGTAQRVLSASWLRLRKASNPEQARWSAGLLLVLLLVPCAISMAKTHPYQLSYYSELVGGLPGAVRLGFETTFWCETYKDALPYLNANAPQGASLWSENPFVLRFYQRIGMLRPDLEPTGGDIISPSEADYALVQMRQTGFLFYTPETVDVAKDHDPLYTVERQGVPLFHLYRLGQ